MKLNRTFIVCVVVFTVLALALQMQLPEKFDWNATYSPNDANPFGCMLFDSVLHASMPKGYRVEKTTLADVTASKKNENVMLISPGMYIDSASITNIGELTRQGKKIMIVTEELYYSDDSLKNAFGMDLTSSSRFGISVLRNELKNKQNVTDTIYWSGEGFKKRIYKLLYQLVDYPEWKTYGDVDWDTLAYLDVHESVTWKEFKVPVAVSRKLNSGEVILVSSPLLFTNYSMLEGETSGYIFRMMSYIADKPVVRVARASRMTDAQWERENSPLRAILQERPLKWAFYTAIAVLFLFFIFTARRRQRAIPVIDAPKNHTLEFTQLIGTLFYQRHDHAGLVRRKWELFATRIRQDVGVDVQALDNDDELFTRLSARTGLAYEDIAVTIKNLRYIVMNDNDITREQMEKAIDKMSEILEKTK